MLCSAPPAATARASRGRGPSRPLEGRRRNAVVLACRTKTPSSGEETSNNAEGGTGLGPSLAVSRGTPPARNMGLRFQKAEGSLQLPESWLQICTAPPSVPRLWAATSSPAGQGAKRSGLARPLARGGHGHMPPSPCTSASQDQRPAPATLTSAPLSPDGPVVVSPKAN